MKNDYSKNIALSAMFTAISVFLCFFASIFPSMSLSITGIAGLISAIALLQCGCKYSLLVYIASSILALLLVPNKQCAVAYLVLFGHYPMLKMFTERLKSKVIVWAAKICEAGLLYFVVFLISTYILGIHDSVGAVESVLTGIFFVVVFVLYDICLDRIMKVYISKLLQNRRFH